MNTTQEKIHNKVWNNCLRIIKDNVPSISFRTWFEPIVPIKLESNILTIQVPSPFFYEYLEEQYIDILRKTLRKELGSDAKLEYCVVMENNSYANNGTGCKWVNDPSGGYCVSKTKKTCDSNKRKCFV